MPIPVYYLGARVATADIPALTHKLAGATGTPPINVLPRVIAICPDHTNQELLDAGIIPPHLWSGLGIAEYLDKLGKRMMQALRKSGNDKGIERWMIVP
jgi:hypothetical protein